MTEPLQDLERYRWTCPRALVWHGNRRAAAFLAEIPADPGVDRYGAGGVVEILEEEVRSLLGKPAVVFMPSGTMAQQIALRIHADRRRVRTVAMHPTSHLVLHEEEAYRHLHDLVHVPIGDARALFTGDDLHAIREPLAAVLFELPQREIGGLLPKWTDLEAQVDVVRERGAAVHLDGARVWECTPYYGRLLAEIAALFDTVYVSFYKGLGGLAGACLAGEEDVIAAARIWRKRHGGALFGMWPNAASALGAMRKRLPLMSMYVEHARSIATVLRDVPNVEIVPDPPQTTMMHLHLRVGEEDFLERARRIAAEEGLFTWSKSMPGPRPDVRVVEFTVGDATLKFRPEEVARIVRQLVRR